MRNITEFEDQHIESILGQAESRIRMFCLSLELITERCNETSDYETLSAACDTFGASIAAEMDTIKALREKLDGLSPLSLNSLRQPDVSCTKCGEARHANGES